MKLSGARVMLTGATGGIGHSIARRAAKAGAKLTLTGRRADVLDELAGEIGAEVRVCDLADRSQVSDLAREAVSSGIEVLINNAALPGSGDVLDFEIDEIDRAIEVNLRAPIVLSRIVGEHLAHRGSGHLVFISSLAGKTGNQGSAIYSATKFGLRGFAQGLREDLGPRGVGVSTIFPGFIRDAGMFADSHVELPRFVGTSTPEEVAEAVAGAVEHNRGEVDVAPLTVRVGSNFASVFPEPAHMFTRWIGTDIGARVAENQHDKR